ncbi:MAG TPA: hypothetical protein VJX94_26645 [Stellaceae bacterium]|nr:hypothetical protein [Stellaceae bacterium]
MKRSLRAVAVAAAVLGNRRRRTGMAQRAGGVTKMFSPDSPASMSILEEATAFSQRPMMGVFNNLVIYDQHVEQNSLDSIFPDLATGWSWNEDGTERTWRCTKVCGGTTADPSPRRTCNAPGTCCSAGRTRRCDSIPTSRGTAISKR